MTPIHVLLLCGGGSSEHDVSLLSANYLESVLKTLANITYTRIEISQSGAWLDEQHRICQLTLNKTLQMGDVKQHIDYVIPCIHGFPGETGDIQSLFILADLPYFGCDPVASNLCFNKITSKLWFDALGIPNTPYVFLTDDEADSIEKAEMMFDKWGSIFVKAASQGSSVGCYQVTDKTSIKETIKDAFNFSDQVLIEKAVKPRELEIAAYHYKGEVIITRPGEICCPSGKFYTFDEKYSQQSLTETTLTPSDLTEQQIESMRSYAEKAFVHLRLKDISRIDFFLTEEGDILLNEINTFPGMTPISMFPKLLSHHGHDFAQYLQACIVNGSQQKEIK